MKRIRGKTGNKEQAQWEENKGKETLGGVGSMGKKALIVATVSGFVPQFEMGNVKILQSLGYEVHYASNYKLPFYGKDNSRLEGTGIVRHQVDFVRSPFRARENLKAFQQLRRLQEREVFDLVHCHTPMGGVLGRLVFGMLGRGRTKVLYTAHGFHFYKGASFKNWLLYYPVEKFLSRWTDVLITINKEDYRKARGEFHAKKLEYVPGVGIDTEFYGRSADGWATKEGFGIPENTTVLLSVGELSRRKNHKVVIESIAKMRNPKMVYCICGDGSLRKELREQAEALGVRKQVRFLGYCQDIGGICQVADIFVFPSLQEGLPVALMEAMASGLPCIVSDIRGNRDLIVEGKGGILCQPDSIDGFEKALEKLIRDKEKCKKMGDFNQKMVKRFDVSQVNEKMKRIYKELIDMDVSN